MMDPETIAKLITEDDDYDTCPLCGSEFAIIYDNDVACPSPACKNYNTEYGDYINSISWYRIEFGIGMRQLREVFTKILHMGGKVIDVVGPGEFVAIFPTLALANEFAGYVNSVVDANWGDMNAYTWAGARNVQKVTSVDLQADDISNEWLKFSQ